MAPGSMARDPPGSMDRDSPVQWIAITLDDSLEQLHLDARSRLDVAGRVVEDDEAVGVAHRLEDSRSLLAGRTDRERAVARAREDAALELGASRRLLQPRAAGRAEGRHRLGR